MLLESQEIVNEIVPFFCTRLKSLIVLAIRLMEAVFVLWGLWLSGAAASLQYCLIIEAHVL